MWEVGTNFMFVDEVITKRLLHSSVTKYTAEFRYLIWEVGANFMFIDEVVTKRLLHSSITKYTAVFSNYLPWEVGANFCLLYTSRCV